MTQRDVTARRFTFPSRRLVADARSILRGTGGDRSDRDTLKALWHLLLPDECGRNGSEEVERV